MSKRKAIIFGVNNYPDKEINNLSGAVRDATGIKERLQKYGGFEVSHFYTDEQATSVNMRKAIHDLLWRPEELDIALLYFAGHGFKDPYHIGYIAPHDMILDEPFVYGLGMDELKNAISKAQNKKVIIAILDCCHSGISTGPTRGHDRLDGENFDQYFDKDLESMGEGKFILASCGADQKAREIKIRENEKDVFHGAFSYHLLQGFDGPAADSEGIVTLERWYDYAYKEFAQPGVQKPKRYSINSGGTIRIGRSPQKNKEFLTEIESLVARNESIIMIDACPKLKRFCDDDPANPTAQKCREKIDAHFESMKEPVSKYMTENRALLQLKVPNLRKTALKLIPNLCFNKICEMPLGHRDLVGALCEACSEGWPINDFISLVSYMEREVVADRSQPAM